MELIRVLFISPPMTVVEPILHHWAYFAARWWTRTVTCYLEATLPQWGPWYTKWFHFDEQGNEIGYTWYAKSYQRTHVNTVCKLMLLEHAFDTLGAAVVGWRTDNYNFASRRAIERLGAKLDGVIRHHALRRDGTVRDTHMYSVAAGEWPEVRAHLHYQLKRHAS